MGKTSLKCNKEQIWKWELVSVGTWRGCFVQLSLCIGNWDFCSAHTASVKLVISAVGSLPPSSPFSFVYILTLCRSLNDWNLFFTLIKGVLALELVVIESRLPQWLPLMETLISSECTASSFHGHNHANKSELQTLFLLIGSLSCRNCSCHCFKQSCQRLWEREAQSELMALGDALLEPA